jgi:hypothetical protein
VSSCGAEYSTLLAIGIKLITVNNRPFIAFLVDSPLGAYRSSVCLLQHLGNGRDSRRNEPQWPDKANSSGNTAVLDLEKTITRRATLTPYHTSGVALAKLGRSIDLRCATKKEKSCKGARGASYLLERGVYAVTCLAT